MRMTVKIDDTTHEVVALGLGGAVAFERHFGIPASVLDPEDPTPNRTEWTAFIIYKSLQKAGAIPKTASFDEAIDTLEEAEIEQIAEPGDEGYEGDGDEEPDPTEAPEAQPGS